MSQENVELVRSIYAGWGSGDFSSAVWADPEIEFAFVDGPEPGSWSGRSAMAQRYGEWLSGWKDFRAELEELIVVDSTRILAFVHNSARGRVSDVKMDERSVANLFEINSGRVTRVALYWDRNRALQDAGLEE
jgi:ketosteroid isomerase-like protein